MRFGYADIWREMCEAVYLVYGRVDENIIIKSFGTAFSVSPDGLFLTATHVLDGIREIAGKQNITYKLMLKSMPGYGIKEREFEVTTIVKEWTKDVQDISLLKVNVDEKIPFIRVRTQGPLEAPGRPVAALGYPLPHEKKDTNTIFITQRTFHGVICAIPSYDVKFPMYEVDTVFIPGISGGPLISLIDRDAVGVIWGTRTNQLEGVKYLVNIALAKVLTQTEEETTIGKELESLGVMSSRVS